VAAKSGSGVTFEADQLLWYIAFNEWVLIAFPDIHFEIEEDLQTGRLAYLLSRPVSYIASRLAEGLGTLLVHLLVLGCVAFSLTWFWTDHLPMSPLAFGTAIILGVFAGFVGVIYQVLIGLSAFWLHDVIPLNWIWEKLMYVFGGLILPLATYPQWMQAIAHWTPGAAILGGRSALALHFDFQSFGLVALSLFSWGALGLALICLVYWKGLRIVNIEGG
jgi:ABC-2 type transport system permease protein